MFGYHKWTSGREIDSGLYFATCLEYCPKHKKFQPTAKERAHQFVLVRHSDFSAQIPLDRSEIVGCDVGGVSNFGVVQPTPNWDVYLEKRG